MSSLFTLNLFAIVRFWRLRWEQEPVLDDIGLFTFKLIYKKAEYLIGVLPTCTRPFTRYCCCCFSPFEISTPKML